MSKKQTAMHFYSALILLLCLGCLGPNSVDALIIRTPPGHAAVGCCSPLRCFSTRCTASTFHMSEADSTLNACRAMRASEIKAELDLRGVAYADCYEKEELAERLAKARRSGEADPEILRKFNEASAQRAWEADATEQDVEPAAAAVDVTAGDGSLPGGLTPEKLLQMSQNPEMMALLRNPKMQEVMAEVMSKGEAGYAKFADDPEVSDMLKRFQAFMS